MSDEPDSDLLPDENEDVLTFLRGMEPGAWLWVGIVWGVWILVLSYFINSKSRVPLSDAAAILMLTAQSLPFGVGAVMQFSRPWWVAVLLSIVVFLLGMHIPIVGVPMMLLASPTALILLVVAIVMDERRRQPRSWIHWTGAAAMAILLLIYISWLISVARRASDASRSRTAIASSIGEVNTHLCCRNN